MTIVGVDDLFALGTFLTQSASNFILLTDLIGWTTPLLRALVCLPEVRTFGRPQDHRAFRSWKPLSLPQT